MVSLDEIKFCSSCGHGKRLSYFHNNKSEKDGRHSQCKECRKQYSEKNSERIVDRHRKWWLVRKFGITEQEYDNLLVKQNYKCAICGIDQSHSTRRLAVDHCHNTGKIRGLLCSNCNTGIGNLRDDVELLRKAIIYLEQ